MFAELRFTNISHAVFFGLLVYVGYRSNLHFYHTLVIINASVFKIIDSSYGQKKYGMMYIFSYDSLMHEMLFEVYNETRK